MSRDIAKQVEECSTRGRSRSRSCARSLAPVFLGALTEPEGPSFLPFCAHREGPVFTESGVDPSEFVSLTWSDTSRDARTSHHADRVSRRNLDRSCSAGQRSRRAAVELCRNASGP
jgi:hypothetical protein